jgi:hypothetical protein
MPQFTVIKGPDGTSADVIQANGHKGLVTSTIPGLQYTPKSKAFTDPNGNINLNIDASSSGTPDGIHNGTDSVLWTAVAASGTWDFASTTHAAEGIGTIVDYTALSGVTVTINGTNITNTTLTEGVDWTAATSNTATATSLASAINGVSGVSSSASVAVVTVLADASADITTFTSSDGTNAPVQAASIDATATVNGDQALITRSSAIDVDNYNSVSGFIYITQFNASGNGIIVSLQIAGAPNGLAMDLADFVNTSDLNVWQKFTVPISTFEAAGNVDEFSVVTVRTSGQPPNYYLDTIQLEEGGSIVYTAEPERGFRYEFNAVDILFIDALDTTLLNNSMPNLSYDKILGVPQLANGVTLRFTQAGRVQFSGTFRDLGGLLFAAFAPSAQGCDGTNTFLKLTADLSEFARMEPSRGDKIELIISDDLSGLLQFRANIRGRELVT